MKIWTSDHTFSHPWDTVVKASLRKYPNPMNPAVKGIDVIERELRSNGTLHSHRLIASEWGFPNWACKILGMASSKTCYASEYSSIDPTRKSMTLETKNLTFCKELSIVEKLTYQPHPDRPESETLLKQEAVITVHGVPLSSYIEDIISKTISSNANKGRLAMEYVIGKINTEVQGLSKSVDGLAASAKRCIEDMPHHHHHQEMPHFNFQGPKS